MFFLLRMHNNKLGVDVKNTYSFQPLISILFTLSVPEEFQYDPVSKSYGDPSRRPEIKSATIEFIAPGEYMLRPPQPAVYLFLLDVSQLARDSGYLQVRKRERNIYSVIYSCLIKNKIVVVGTIVFDLSICHNIVLL